MTALILLLVTLYQGISSLTGLDWNGVSVGRWRWAIAQPLALV
jgi:hypothetical protein